MSGFDQRAICSQLGSISSIGVLEARIKQVVGFDRGPQRDPCCREDMDGGGCAEARTEKEFGESAKFVMARIRIVFEWLRSCALNQPGAKRGWLGPVVLELGRHRESERLIMDGIAQCQLDGCDRVL